MATISKQEQLYVWEGNTIKGFLHELSDFVEETGIAMGLDERARCDIELAVGEAAANSWEHSYGGKQGRLRLEMEKDHEAVEIRLTDWGKPYTLEDAPEPEVGPDLNKTNLNGLGLMIMRKAMDKVETTSVPKVGNSIIMRKRLAA